jgi:hypothetical protein
MLAMSVTNAYLATVHCMKLDSLDPPEHFQFIEELAYELKDNIFAEDQAVARTRSNGD